MNEAQIRAKRGPHLRRGSSWSVPARRWAGALLALLLAATLGAPGAPGPAQAQTVEVPRVHPQLVKEATAAPDRPFRVVVVRLNQDRAADRAVEAAGGRKIQEVSTVGFAAELPGRAVANLGRNPAVRWVTPDAAMLPTGSVDTGNLATIYDQTVNATQLWSTGVSSDLAGQGVGVAVLDTGVKTNLPDFGNGSGGSRIVASAVFNTNTTNMNDWHGHGTHIAGIIGGNSWWSTASVVQGKYLGVAPKVNLINVKVSDDQGMAYLSDVVNAVDWVIANRTTFNIRVMNFSLISSVAESYTTSPLAAAMERAWFSGILVVVSAGNLGPDTMLYPPASDPFVVTVGAADLKGTAARGDDGMAPWSSYGTTQDGFAKPEVVAPGRYMTSTLAASDVTLAKQFPERIVDSRYIWLSGTSMAAPVVAGVAALAFQAHPEWTNDQVKWLLAQTATKLGTTVTATTIDPATGATTTSTVFTPYPGQGAGLVDAAAAVTYAGTPQYANQGLTISAQLVGPNGATVYDTSSWSTSSWSTSSWSTSSWSTSSWSTSSWSTLVALAQAVE